MKKIAFFVEGATERIFLRFLLLEVFDKKKINLTEKRISGGSSSPIKISLIQSVPAVASQDYFILIYDCGGDSAVSSYVIDQQKSLIKNGFTKIVGIRDLYPLNDLKKLKSGLRYGIKTTIDIGFVIAVQETEAWFLADIGHFSKLNSAFTLDVVKNELGIDLETIDLELIAHPSETLDKIYQLIGFRYVSSGKKSEARIKRTCLRLDYAEMYVSHPQRLPSLKDLIIEIDSCF